MNPYFPFWRTFARRCSCFLTLAWMGLLAGLAPARAETALVETKIDWPAFLAPKDMLWSRVPTNIYNAPFLGNGVVGMQMLSTNDTALRWEVARMDAGERLDNVGNLYGKYRLPIGAFTLTTGGKIQKWDLRLDLWNAELRGTVATEKGTLTLRAYVHATQPLLVVEYAGLDGESEPRLEWHPYPSVSPREAAGRPGPKNLPPSPPGAASKTDDVIHAWTQALRPSGAAVTAWKQVTGNAPRAGTLFISIAHSFPEDTAFNEAVGVVRQAAASAPAALVESHRAWWHAFYPDAFLSFNDPYWDPFYWTQIYKLGSGMRADGVVLDLQGPWMALRKNPWPGIWWNLNVQLTYWPCYTGNRLDIAASLPNTLRKYRQNLIDNVPEKYRADSAALPRSTGVDCRRDTGWPGAPGNEGEVGSLPWTCHNLFTHYRLTMDDTFLRDDVFPLLRRAINYYLHFLEKGDDGKLHLPSTHSPEYGNAPDCNYDLALLRWGCETLLWSADRLKINDPLIPRWREVRRDLVDYPVDKNGYMIGHGVPFAKTHRHYSHLFMVYPLHIVDTDNPEVAALVDKSVRHWHSLKGGLTGYSFSGGASLYASLQRGDDALAMLDGLKHSIQPNTLYRESGPVIETPLSGVASIHDMLLQSWNGLVNVFPAAPRRWSEVAFHDLRAEGAFLVSASRKNGQTQWVRVKSLAGEPLRLRIQIADTAVLSGTGAAALKRDAQGDWVGTPARDTEILIALPGVTPQVAPLSSPAGAKVFGLP